MFNDCEEADTEGVKGWPRRLFPIRLLVGNVNILLTRQIILMIVIKSGREFKYNMIISDTTGVFYVSLV